MIKVSLSEQNDYNSHISEQFLCLLTSGGEDEASKCVILSLSLAAAK